MAYTDIPTVSVGDLYTAANFNTHLRDNFAAGIPDKFTAKGDVAFGEGADTIGILALGNDGDWLTCDAAETLGVKWAAPTGLFDWFTFGAFSSPTWDNVAISTVYSTFTINDIPTGFSIPDTGAHLFLTSLSVRRNTDGGSGYNPSDGIVLRGMNDTGKIFISAQVLGALNYDSTGFVWNTQTGLMVSDVDQDVRLNTYNTGFNVIIKIWGYA